MCANGRGEHIDVWGVKWVMGSNGANEDRPMAPSPHLALASASTKMPAGPTAVTRAHNIPRHRPAKLVGYSLMTLGWIVAFWGTAYVAHKTYIVLFDWKARHEDFNDDYYHIIGSGSYLVLFVFSFWFWLSVKFFRHS